MATSPFLGEVSSMHSELVLVPISAACYNIVCRPKMPLDQMTAIH